MQNLLPLSSCLFWAVLLSIATTGRIKALGQEGCRFSKGISYEHASNYMSASVSGTKIGNIGYLYSPWFGATPGRECTLQFRYYLGQDACQLSVLFRDDTTVRSTTKLWSTTNATGEDFKEVKPIVVPRSNCRHRIIFKAKKVGGGHCGFTVIESVKYDEVGIDDIKFGCRDVQSKTTTTTTEPSPPSTPPSSTPPPTTTTRTPPAATTTTTLPTTTKTTTASAARTTFYTTNATSTPSTASPFMTKVTTEREPNPTSTSQSTVDDTKARDDKGFQVIVISIVVLVAVTALVAALLAVYCLKWYKHADYTTGEKNFEIRDRDDDESSLTDQNGTTS